MDFWYLFKYFRVKFLDNNLFEGSIKPFKSGILAILNIWLIIGWCPKYKCVHRIFKFNLRTKNQKNQSLRFGWPIPQLIKFFKNILEAKLYYKLRNVTILYRWKQDKVFSGQSSRWLCNQLKFFSAKFVPKRKKVEKLFCHKFVSLMKLSTEFIVSFKFHAFQVFVEDAWDEIASWNVNK